MAQGQSRQKHKTLSEKQTNAKRDGDVAQIVDPVPSKSEVPVYFIILFYLKVTVLAPLQWGNQTLSSFGFPTYP
jgi:hypothetical protein